MNENPIAKPGEKAIVDATSTLRFVVRNGKHILQQMCFVTPSGELYEGPTHTEWRDVPITQEDDESTPLV